MKYVQDLKIKVIFNRFISPGYFTTTAVILLDKVNFTSNCTFFPRQQTLIKLFSVRLVK